MARKPSILVAMSGGVDSSVAAALLVQRGYDVVGVTLQIWQESQTDPRHAGCCSLGAVEDARRVARNLGIPHYVLNFRDAFRKSVIDQFIEEYAEGRTPNPCVQCNKHVKFDVLLEKTRELGCDRLVTGHYARIRRRDGAFHLLRARSPHKDQSYVLYMLDQAQLASTWFPLGEVPNKDAVRGMARELGLHLADKPDSQEICFVSEAGGHREFLRKQRPELFAPGEVVDEEGRTLGTHEGTAGFTIGQRRGLGVAGGRPLYVLDLQPKSNRVVMGPAERLETREVRLDEVVWGGGLVRSEPIRVTAKIRYNMEAQPALLVPGERPRLVFDRPVRAATPGQMAVAYRGATVVAGGVIPLPERLSGPSEGSPDTILTTESVYAHH